MSDYDRMAAMFGESGLVVPPVQDRFRAALREQGPWHWATCDVDPMEMYMLTPYIERVLRDKVDDHVAITHGGHGSNSYSLNVGIVSDGLTMAVQTLWGGVYTDADVAADRWSQLMAGCASVLEAHASADAEASSLDRRLVVFDSDFRDVRRCQWLQAEGVDSVDELVGSGASSPMDPLSEARRS